MRTSIDSYLDGEVGRDALSPAEQERIAPLEMLLGEINQHVRGKAPPADLVARVMAALPAEPTAHPPAPPSRWRHVLDWLWNPQPVQLRLRPAYGMALMLLLAVAGTQLFERAATDAPEASLTVEPAPPLFVQFRLEAPEAREVALAGSFTNWQPRYELQETAPGVWTVLVPLVPGVHDYTFVVDGEQWIVDPHAPQVPDSFGGSNSRLTLLTPWGEV